VHCLFPHLCLPLLHRISLLLYFLFFLFPASWKFFTSFFPLFMLFRCVSLFVSVMFFFNSLGLDILACSGSELIWGNGRFRWPARSRGLLEKRRALQSLCHYMKIQEMTRIRSTNVIRTRCINKS
jgi:hypothetical protein